ncbi:hypothetical protein [Halegenticoccus tardaugens]|uniref:hypothetical protein n=1 Tax=Halegenticoccus tardaugens TaxID=2071624 RepID=UPI001E417E2D|nr:hypothetical protein [Halegenticoccus tardaugens]
MSDNDRAEKLAGRWGGSNTPDDSSVEDAADEQASQTNSRIDEQATQSNRHIDEQADGSSQSSSTPSQTAEQLSTREMKSQMVYLHPDFYQELDLAFDELNLRYKREHGETLEKNRHYFAGLLRLGFEQLGDVRERELAELTEDLNIPHR